MTVDLLEKVAAGLLEAHFRSWFDMLQRSHIAMKVQLIADHLAEEIGVVDIGLPYSMAKRPRRLEAESRSPTSVDSSDSSTQSAMVVHCYYLEQVLVRDLE